MIGTGVSHALQTTTAAPPGASVELAPPAPELTSAAGRAWAGTIVWPAVALALVFGLALWLRLIGLGGAVTEDEDQWIARSGTFARGLETRDWQRTFLTGHPGVTVMWVTSLTLGLERAAPFAVVRGGPDVTVIPGFLPALHDARVPFAVLQSLLVIACAALVMRLLNVGGGLVAGR